MSKTMKEQIIKKDVDERMKDPKFCYIIADTMAKYNSGFYDECEHKDVVFQKWQGNSIDIYDIYCFLQVHAMIGLDEIVMCSIDLGETPGMDKDIEGNNKKLQKLWHPFSGEFYGGNSDEDGCIRIAEPIKMSTIGKGEKITIEPHFPYFPLEVGYTSSIKTFFYMVMASQSGQLARWPYGSKYIYLMKRRDEYIKSILN